MLRLAPDAGSEEEAQQGQVVVGAEAVAAFGLKDVASVSPPLAFQADLEKRLPGPGVFCPFQAQLEFRNDEGFVRFARRVALQGPFKIRLQASVRSIITGQ